ncbi:MAG: DUF1080 domain-containing protein, partial [Luteitalea sp.]|nr:DUF1080 domain-containing protein [Luteitalea sp.]
VPPSSEASRHPFGSDCGEGQDGFVSLMPEHDIGEHWIIEGSAETWSLHDGMIYCAGSPRGFLRSKQSYRDFVFRAEWRLSPAGGSNPRPTTGPMRDSSSTLKRCRTVGRAPLRSRGTTAKPEACSAYAAAK